MAGPGIEPRTLATLSGALPLSHHADIHGPFSPNYYKLLTISYRSQRSENLKSSRSDSNDLAQILNLCVFNEETTATVHFYVRH